MNEPASLTAPPAPETAPEEAPARGRRLTAPAPVRRLLAWYEHHPHLAPLFFFFGGVTWDALTLRRIDYWVDNLFIGSYLLLLGAVIVLAVLVASGHLASRWARHFEPWYPAAIQFLMGALFSAYVVYYVQSASLTTTSLFLLLLVALLVGNEFIHRRLLNLYLLFGLYYLLAFSFFVFFVPIVLRAMNYGTFLLGGLLAAALVVGILVFLRRRGVFERARQFVVSVSVIAALFGLMNVFYLQDWMPPVPLAMRYGGVFHEVERQGDGYLLRYEEPSWTRFWVHSDRVFHHAEGDTVFAFAAIFAPTRLKKEIHHAWRYYDEAQGAWVTSDEMRYRVVGGRDGGYRGYTFKRNLRPGRWRVDVRTDDGKTLGRIRFEVVPAEATNRRWVERVYE